MVYPQLSGVNKGHAFVDRAGGRWLGEWGYDHDLASQELDMIKSIGAKAVRFFFSYDFVKYNTIDADKSQLPFRSIIRDLAELCNAKGLTLILAGYCVVHYGENGHQQDKLPFPPFTMRTDIIANSQEWINLWKILIDDLQGLNNIVIDPHNEPDCYPEPNTIWISALQDFINQIRGSGFQGYILAQLGYSCWANLDYIDVPEAQNTMEWVYQYPLTDTLQKLIYSTHLYREYKGFGYWEFSHDAPPDQFAYLEPDILEAFNLMFKNVEPLFIGELGCDLDAGEQELTAYSNALKILKSKHIDFCGQNWRARADGSHALFTDETNPLGTLTESGMILREALQSQPVSIGIPSHIWMSVIALVGLILIRRRR